MGKNLDGMEAYKEEAISQGAKDYCQTIQRLQAPVATNNAAIVKQISN